MILIDRYNYGTEFSTNEREESEHRSIIFFRFFFSSFSEILKIKWYFFSSYTIIIALS